MMLTAEDILAITAVVTAVGGLAAGYTRNEIRAQIATVRLELANFKAQLAHDCDDRHKRLRDDLTMIQPPRTGHGSD